MAATIGPRIVQVLEFASARAPELQALHEVAHHTQMLSPADAKLDAQRNQRRRRANAFKSHRMPQRLRQKKAKPGQAEELIALPVRDATQAKQQSEMAQPADGTGKQQTEKPRARKHERRPHKLLAARSWQQQSAPHNDDNDADSKTKAVWLATHLWHSKRMKMVEKYGMALPAHRADKSVSASLEALRSRATLHDQSYYSLLELYGLPQLILEALQLVSDPAGSDFHGMRFLSGGEEGQSVLYHEDQFPSGAICPVTFLWRPLQTDLRSGAGTDGSSKFELHADWQKMKRQLWLWIHPAAFMEAASAIKSACQSILEGSDDEIQVTDRRGQLCRFKLRGALADDFLEQVCGNDHRPQQQAGDVPERGLEADSDHEDGFQPLEIAEQCTGTNLALLMNRLSAKQKESKTNAVGLSSALPSTERSLYSVVVSDPRVRLHNQHLASKSARIPGSDALSLLREPTLEDIASKSEEIQCPVSSEPLTKSGKDDAEEPESELILQKLSAILRWTRTPSAASSAGEAFANYPFASPLDGKQNSTNSDVAMTTEAEEVSNATLVPCSYLWSHSKRQQLSKAFQKDHVVNGNCFQARQDQSQRLVPVSSSIAERQSLHLIMVEQRGPFPSTSGWDLILTPSFAPTLLKTLVYAGALVVGLDEDEALDTVLQRPSFPRDYPDTLAGESYWKAEADAQQSTYLKKPKAKRFSYEKHGIALPFQPNWKQLFPNVDGADENTRGEAKKEAGESEDDEAPTSPCVLRGEEYMTPFCFYKPTEASVAKIPVAVPTLVRVVVRAPGRATFAPNAMLYLPTADNVKQFYAQKNWNGCEIIDLKAPERSLVGFVTSAVYDRPKGAFRALGFCACELLQDVFLQQRELLQAREALVMLRTPHAKMYRPVLIRAEA